MGFTKVTTNVQNISALPDKVNNQADWLKGKFDQAGVDLKTAVNGLIDELSASSAGNNIGVDIASVASKTLQSVLETYEVAIANRYTKTETDTSISQNTNNLVADVDVNLTTGVITVTKKDGTTETFDTALEKVPATFEIVERNDEYYLKITNVDGTSTQTDITSLMNIYEFNNSDDLAFSVSGTGNKKIVTASIRANSIGLDKLSLSAVSTLEGYVNSASSSAIAAATSATTASTQADIASEAAITATSKASEATAGANIASQKAAEASDSAAEAKSWAEQAQASSQGGDMLKSVYDTDGNGVVDNAEKLGGQLPEYYAKSSELSNKQDILTFDSTPTSGSNNPVTSGGVKNSLDNLLSTLTGIEIVSGTYTGNSGNASESQIISLGFKPKLLIITHNSSLKPLFNIQSEGFSYNMNSYDTDTSANTTVDYWGQYYIRAGDILLTNEGFSASNGTSAGANRGWNYNNEIYNYIAFK